MSFHQQSWAAREGKLGDEAEGVFFSLHPNSVKYGLDRPPINLAKVPAFIRYTPDFLMHNRLVEVMGLGRDGLLKLKVDKLVALNRWGNIFPVSLFVWNSHRQVWAMVDLVDVNVAAELSQELQFPEGKPYYSINLDQHNWTWIDA